MAFSANYRNTQTINGIIIHTEQHYRNEWTAVTDDYDGPESPIGTCTTEQGAVDDLLAQIEPASPAIGA